MGADITVDIFDAQVLAWYIVEMDRVEGQALEQLRHQFAGWCDGLFFSSGPTLADSYPGKMFDLLYELPLIERVRCLVELRARDPSPEVQAWASVVKL